MNFGAVLAIILLFYLVLPGAGAFAVRSRWRDFRRRLVRSSTLPPVDLKLLFEVAEDRDGRDFSFLGWLDSMQDGRTVWLRNADLSLRLDLGGEEVYYLPARTEADDLTVERWERFSSLPEGTKVYVSGPLLPVAGVPTFRSTSLRRIFVLLYEGSEADLVERAVTAGRQRNEYWNFATPASLAAGCVSLLITGFGLVRTPGQETAAFFAFLASCFPILPYLPPGLVFYLGYRWTWKRARGLRVDRDLLRLKLSFPAGGSQPGAGDEATTTATEKAAARNDSLARRFETASAGFFAVGFALNFILAARLLLWLWRAR